MCNNMWFSLKSPKRACERKRRKFRSQQDDFPVDDEHFRESLRFSLSKSYSPLGKVCTRERRTKPRTSNYSPIRVYHSRARHTVNCFVQKFLVSSFYFLSNATVVLTCVKDALIVKNGKIIWHFGTELELKSVKYFSKKNVKSLKFNFRILVCGTETSKNVMWILNRGIFYEIK